MGDFSVISCINEICIGKNTIIAPNVYITDHNHAYKNVNKAIKTQPYDDSNSISIGSDSWIAKNVVICGNVTIGKHVVIGANSVVNKSIPDFCVAVGSPARVVKKYNFDEDIWEKK